MRREFSDYLEELAKTDDKIVFITGDLGFNAFENLRDLLGDRFINAGVAEQNMVGVAAGMAKKGFKPFVYSIAPFMVYRALEQIRNDVCFHDLAVTFVGNGGGYGYGIMGSTHHALSDIAVMSSLDNMKCYVPAFSTDIKLHIDKIIESKKPAYLRLGYGIENSNTVFKDIQLINKAENPKISIAVMGPLIMNILKHKDFNNIKTYTDIFVFYTYPVLNLSSGFKKSIKESEKLLVLEEHVKTGGLGEQLAGEILSNDLKTEKFDHHFAVSYPEGEYGSQDFHQKKSKLDGDSIIAKIKSMI